MCDRNVSALPKAWLATLVYDRSAVGSGEIWRLWTTHWVHRDFVHGFGNAIAFGLAALIMRPCVAPGVTLLVTLSSCVTVSVALWWMHPDIPAYIGASGVTHALWVVAIGVVVIARPTLWGWCAAAAISRWAWWSMEFGPRPWNLDPAAVVAVGVHQSGMVVGGISLFIVAWTRRWSMISRSSVAAESAQSRHLGCR